MALLDSLRLPARERLRDDALERLTALLEYAWGILIGLSFLLGTLLLVIAAFLTLPFAQGERRLRLYDHYLNWLYMPGVWIAGGKLTVKGLENLPREGGCLIMANHSSLLDIPYMFYLLHQTGQVQRMRMLAKMELYKIPLFGDALRLSGFIPVNRKNMQEALASYARVRAALAQGTHIWIAPEGQRSADGHLLPFKKGPFITAVESGAVIVPVAFAGLHRMLPKGSMWVRARQEVTITIGPAWDSKHYGEANREALRDQVYTWFAHTLADHGQGPQ